MKKFIISTLLCVFSLFSAFAQVEVKGLVVDSSGEPIIGASVVEKDNSGAGTATDIDGNFTLKVKSANSSLVVSFIGMQTATEKLNGRTSGIKITLTDGSINIDEVVIVGYGTQKKINATGAVKTIDNSTLEARPISNAVQGLQGAIAGLNITNDNGGGLGE